MDRTTLVTLAVDVLVKGVENNAERGCEPPARLRDRVLACAVCAGACIGPRWQRWGRGEMVRETEMEVGVQDGYGGLPHTSLG